MNVCESLFLVPSFSGNILRHQSKETKMEDREELTMEERIMGIILHMEANFRDPKTQLECCARLEEIAKPGKTYPYTGRT